MAKILFEDDKDEKYTEWEVPLGYTASRRRVLKKYFIEQKIPSYKRDEVPIIIDGENIVCVVPYRISDLYKVSENTKNIIKFEITKEK